VRDNETVSYDFVLSHADSAMHDYLQRARFGVTRVLRVMVAYMYIGISESVPNEFSLALLVRSIMRRRRRNDRCDCHSGIEFNKSPIYMVVQLTNYLLARGIM